MYSRSSTPDPSPSSAANTSVAGAVYPESSAQAIGSPGSSGSWIMIDSGCCRAIQSALPDPTATPSSLAMRSPSGSEVEEAQISFGGACGPSGSRSEEHTSELQSRFDLVCRLL